MAAYKKEDYNQHPRISQDVPSNFQEWKQIVDQTPVIVLYLWSEGCRPCLMIRDRYEALAAKHQSDHIKFFKDNIDNPMGFHRGQVEAVPSFFLLVDGKELNNGQVKSRYTGWTEEMQQVIPQLLPLSQRYQSFLVRQNTMEEEPEMVCKNNVCYLRRP